MKTKLFAIILAALAISMLAGFTPGESGAREYYAGLLRKGIITEAEFGKLEAYGFELPESEQSPLDGFVIGEVTTCAIGEQG